MSEVLPYLAGGVSINKALCVQSLELDRLSRVSELKGVPRSRPDSLQASELAFRVQRSEVKI